MFLYTLSRERAELPGGVRGQKASLQGNQNKVSRPPSVRRHPFRAAGDDEALDRITAAAVGGRQNPNQRVAAEGAASDSLRHKRAAHLKL